MEIDWFTVIAQVVNFLILVWLLKRFLYKPVLNAIDKREMIITGQLADAEAKKAEALQERELFRQKNEEFDQQRNVELNKVAEEARAERQRQFEKVRVDSETLRLKFDDALTEEQQKISGEIRQKIQNEVFEITSKTLSDLGSASLEEQIVNVFIKRLNNLAQNEKNQFKKSFNSAGNPIMVKTAFGLLPSAKSGLENAVNIITGEKMIFQYAVDTSLISGLELSVKDYKLSWNIESYLDDLEKHIGLSFQGLQKKEENAVQ